MNTKRISNIGVSMVATYLLKKEYAVLLPWGDDERYDIVAEKNGKFIRIQVKTCSIIKGVIRISLSSSHRKNGKCVHHKYNSHQIDKFWVYCPNTDKLYNIPMKDVEKQKQIQLRVIASKKKFLNIRLASDYQLQ
jgi:hypothetical protein